MTSINSIICIDCETGGLSPSNNPITQIAYEAFQLNDYEMLGERSIYVKPYNNLILEEKALSYTGITIQKLEEEGLDIKSVVSKMCEDFQSYNTTGSFKKKPILLGHNVGFDIGFIVYAFKLCKVDISKYLDCNEDAFGNMIPKYFDTLLLSKARWGDSDKDLRFNLSACITQAGLQSFEAHSALDDVRATTGLFLYLIDDMREKGNVGGGSSMIRENTVRKTFQF